MPGLDFGSLVGCCQLSVLSSQLRRTSKARTGIEGLRRGPHDSWHPLHDTKTACWGLRRDAGATVLTTSVGGTFVDAGSVAHHILRALLSSTFAQGDPAS